MGDWDVDQRGYGSAAVWDAYFRRLRDKGKDLDWRDRWIVPFLAPLRSFDCKVILDLGCGTANEVWTLSRSGLTVIGLDFSGEALRLARRKGVDSPLVQADMAQPLPFRGGTFDAVMSNAALHMFPDRLTRRIIAEIKRVLHPDGWLLLHVNSLEQRTIQERLGLPARELEPDFVINVNGGTDHFFSEDYLRELLADWKRVELHHIPITNTEDEDPFKFVWRVVAQL